jgi:folate-binding protein YgfZ
LVAGSDRTTWLQGLLTNDVAALGPGQGCYALYLTPQGRIIADLGVLHLNEAFLLDVPSARKAAMIERFESFVISEDVELTDLGQSLTRLGIHGPAAAGIVARWIGDPNVSGLDQKLVSLAEYWHVRAMRADADNSREAAGPLALRPGEVLVASSRDFGVPGFDIYLRTDEASSARATMLASGVVPLDAGAAEVLRIEAGRPRFGVDMDEATIPLEAGIEDRAISFTKGCYVGQEIIIRVRDRGHGRVARKLVGLVGAEEGGFMNSQLARGDQLQAGGKEIGRITSGVFSPALGRSIALGYVHRDFVSPGTRIVAVRDGSAVPVVVASLPFVSTGG